MRRALATAVLIVLGSTLVGADEPSTTFTVLEGRHAQALAKQCSRANPPSFQGTWQPSEREIGELEKRLPLLQELKSTLCCIKKARVENVRDYYRQYIGIVVNRRKLIYINAFAISFAQLSRSENTWQVQPVMACDGGHAFWGAIYDPQTKVFSDLALNGEA